MQPLAVTQLDLSTLPEYLFPLMLRNVATSGFPLADPNPQDDVAGQPALSRPGAIQASPSYSFKGGPSDAPGIDQDYVYNWTRDAAITAMEIAYRPASPEDEFASGLLSDYVRFAKTCQETASQNEDGLAIAKYVIDGRVFPGWWPRQNDGPALQALAILAFYDRLDPDTRAIAAEVVAADVDFIVQYWMNANYNLWEEVFGFSFFTRSVQLQCLLTLRANASGLPAPEGIDDAITNLRDLLDQHWDPGAGWYVSVLDPTNPRPGYDPNLDIVLACLYGAVSPTDPRLLATAGLIRQQWTDAAAPGSRSYAINASDDTLGLGPLLGRYPGDGYDGNDTGWDPTTGRTKGHPWAVCTAAFAQLYYRLANTITQAAADFTGLFWEQVDVAPATAPADAASKLRAAGDRMLRAVVYHSDHLELSEQFDATTGYERSVRNLTWSYAAMLSAIRERGQ